MTERGSERVRLKREKSDCNEFIRGHLFNPRYLFFILRGSERRRTKRKKARERKSTDCMYSSVVIIIIPGGIKDFQAEPALI